MFQYDIYLPLRYNDGRDVEPSKLDETRRELINRFGGLTILPIGAPAQGYWRAGSAVYVDEIRVFRVLAHVNDASFWGVYKETLKQRFQQQEVLIVVTPGVSTV